MALAKLAGESMMNPIAGGALARKLEAGGAAAVDADAHEFVTAAFGTEAADAIDRTIVHLWVTDPLAMGSFSSARVGKVEARSTLATPLDNRLYFAGEAISITAHRSLQGANLTAQSAATRIFDNLSAPQ